MRQVELYDSLVPVRELIGHMPREVRNTVLSGFAAALAKWQTPTSCRTSMSYSYAFKG